MVSKGTPCRIDFSGEDGTWSLHDGSHYVGWFAELADAEFARSAFEDRERKAKGHPGVPGDIIFSVAAGEIVRIKGDGTFLVNGEPCVIDAELYHGLKSWLVMAEKTAEQPQAVVVGAPK